MKPQNSSLKSLLSALRPHCSATVSRPRRVTSIALLSSLFTLLSSSIPAATRYPITFISGTVTGYADSVLLPDGCTFSNLPEGGAIMVCTGMILSAGSSSGPTNTFATNSTWSTTSQISSGLTASAGLAATNGLVSAGVTNTFAPASSVYVPPGITNLNGATGSHTFSFAASSMAAYTNAISTAQTITFSGFTHGAAASFFMFASSSNSITWVTTGAVSNWLNTAYTSIPANKTAMVSVACFILPPKTNLVFAAQEVQY
jgi:hypothetical protein